MPSKNVAAASITLMTRPTRPQDFRATVAVDPNIGPNPAARTLCERLAEQAWTTEYLCPCCISRRHDSPTFHLQRFGSQTETCPEAIEADARVSEQRS